MLLDTCMRCGAKHLNSVLQVDEIKSWLFGQRKWVARQGTGIKSNKRNSELSAAEVKSKPDADPVGPKRDGCAVPIPSVLD